MNKGQKRAIWNLLSVLTGAILFTFAVIGYMLFNYNPSGLYEAGSALLAPEVAKSISFKETNPQSGSKTTLTFDSIEFSYKNPVTGQWTEHPIELGTYGKFYNMVSGDHSVVEKEAQEAFKAFEKDRPASLKLKLKSNTQKSSQQDSTVFQEVQFSDQGDFYRVNLHVQSGGGTWAYFHHQNIYRDVTQLFVQQENLNKK